MIPLLAAVVLTLSGPLLHHVAVATGDDRSLSLSDAGCRRCGEPLRHPAAACQECGSSGTRAWMVSILAGAVGVGVAASIGARWVLPAYLWMVAMTVVLFVTDLDHKRIPNRVTYPGTPIGAALLAAGALLDGNTERILPALAGGAAYGAVLFLVFLAARGGFGFGDVKLAVPLGIFLVYLGWDRLLAAGFVTALAGGVVAVVAVVGGSGAKAEIPYGPPMIVGAWAVVVAGPTITDLFL